jgi:hypothetical protein
MTIRSSELMARRIVLNPSPTKHRDLAYIGGRSASLCAEAERGGIALSKGAPRGGDWVAVGRAVSERMRERQMSIAYLSRESGLSETTIRYIGEPSTRHNTSTLVAIAAVLGWHYDYLINVLHGESHKNVPIKSPLEIYFENLLRTEVGAVKEEVVRLGHLVNGIDEKINVMSKAQPQARTG